MQSTKQKYEIYLALHPDIEEKEVDVELTNLEGILTEIGAQNIEIEKEGLKKFAYPIKKYRTGYYACVKFDLDLENCFKVNQISKKLNLNERVLRYLVLNQTDYLKQKAKERPNPNPEFNTHRALNKSPKEPKKCIVKYLGLKAIDYKDVDFLSQFMSPYAKIFSRKKTGTCAKFQRKITKAIKHARHMGLLPFTPKYSL